MCGEKALVSRAQDVGGSWRVPPLLSSTVPIHRRLQLLPVCGAGGIGHVWPVAAVASCAVCGAIGAVCRGLPCGLLAVALL